MGLRDSFLKLLSKGEAPPVDPDEWCELVTIRQHEAPLLVHQLELLDIEVMEREALDLPSRTLSNVTVMVRAADLPAARQATANQP